jgi:predicted glycosyltransferase involved in capsule biosynthesis
MQCKNDNYLENFIQRFTLCISKHIDNIKKLGLEKEVQIVLTDWGSEVKIIDIIDIDFKLIKYIYVNPEIAQKYNKNVKYSYVHPLNVSARNSNGDYIIWGDSDGFLPTESFEKLYNLIKNNFNNFNNSFYWGSRYHIDRKNYINCDNIYDIDKIISQPISFKHDKINRENFIGGGGIFVLTKDMYCSSGGMWEDLIYWGWQDIEFHRRLIKKYNFGNDLEDFGIKIYHLEHYECRIIDFSKSSIKQTNNQICSNNFNANGDNWGLSNENLEIILKINK